MTASMFSPSFLARKHKARVSAALLPLNAQKSTCLVLFWLIRFALDTYDILFIEIPDKIMMRRK